MFVFLLIKVKSVTFKKIQCSVTYCTKATEDLELTFNIASCGLKAVEFSCQCVYTKICRVYMQHF